MCMGTVNGIGKGGVEVTESTGRGVVQQWHTGTGTVSGTGKSVVQ